MSEAEREGDAITRLQARIDRLDEECRRLRMRVEDLRTNTSYPVLGGRPAQRRAEARWTERIDRLTDLTGRPEMPLFFAGGAAVSFAIFGLAVLLGILTA